MPLNNSAAGAAISALQKSKQELEERLASLQVDLKSPEAVAIQERIEAAERLKREISNIDFHIQEIQRAQKEPVKSGGACSG